MQKVYQRINWENEPSTNTPINEDNLNKIDYALDQIDNRVVNLGGYEGRVAQSEANAKTSENNAKTSADNAKQSENKAKEYMEQAFNATPDGYEQAIEQVKLIDIATSNGYDLYNSKGGGGYRLTDLVGNTEQKTMSGKNLLSVNQFSGDGLGNALSYTPIELKNGVKYKIGLTTSATSGSCEIWFGDENKVDIEKKALTLVDFNNGGELEYTPTQDIYYVRFFQNGGCSYSDVMISEEGGDYEPYCGGTPSPNPSFPQAIENTFDCVEMIQGGISSSGTYETTSNYVRNKYTIPCEPNDIIKFDLENTQNVGIYYYNENGFVSLGSKSSVNSAEFTVPSNVSRFEFKIGISGGVTPQTVGKITLTVNGKYVGQIVELGRNELEYAENKSGYLDSTGAVVSSEWNHKIIEIDSNYDYFMANGSSGNSPKYCWYDSNMKFISYMNTITNVEQKVITPPNTARYFGVSFISSNVEFTVQKQKITTFYLNEPLRETDRVVKVDGVFKVERICREIVLKGTESSWAIQDTTLEDCINPYVSVSGAEKNSQRYYIKSTHFISGNAGSNNPKKGTIILNSSGINMLFQVPKTIATTLDEWKTWLTSNNVIVQIKRAEPIYETLDTESQIALNDMVTFDGVTYIEVDSKIQPSAISGEYGTSKVGAYTLKSLNNTENNALRIEDAVNTMLLLTP